MLTNRQTNQHVHATKNNTLISSADASQGVIILTEALPGSQNRVWYDRDRHPSPPVGLNASGSDVIEIDESYVIRMLSTFHWAYRQIIS